MSARLSVVFAITMLTVLIIRSGTMHDEPVLWPEQEYELPSSSNDSGLRELGRYLFYDPLLSVDSSTSCATCHQQFSAFAHIDHALSHGVYGRIGKRNVPALQNLAWQTSYMWDGAIENLDMQSISPITGHEELGETLPQVLMKVRSSTFYKDLIANAYGSDSVTIPRILTALGRFCASLISSNSRYDRYMLGKDTLSLQERHGLTLFRMHCASCHTEPLFTNNGFASNGLQADTMLHDIGRSRVTHVDDDMYKFRIPSLRNIAVTQPYMHDGRFKKLREVVAFYGAPEQHAPYADKRVRSIGLLRDDERKDIIAFLLTLTDHEFLRAPQHRDPFIQASRSISPDTPNTSK